jgi:hypothetical protein
VRKLQYIAELERKVQALQVRSFIKYVNYSSKSSFSFYILLLMSIYATKKNIYILQAEGMEVSAEMEFLSQQNIMLDLENKALNQRLESLNQEQLIKRCILFLSSFFLTFSFQSTCTTEDREVKWIHNCKIVLTPNQQCAGLVVILYQLYVCSDQNSRYC